MLRSTLLQGCVWTTLGGEDLRHDPVRQAPAEVGEISLDALLMEGSRELLLSDGHLLKRAQNPLRDAQADNLLVLHAGLAFSFDKQHAAQFGLRAAFSFGLLSFSSTLDKWAARPLGQDHRLELEESETHQDQQKRDQGRNDGHRLHRESPSRPEESRWSRPHHPAQCRRKGSRGIALSDPLERNCPCCSLLFEHDEKRRNTPDRAVDNMWISLWRKHEEKRKTGQQKIRCDCSHRILAN